MYKVYSYIEVDGKSFIPPAIKGEKSPLPVYLMVADGRHYISVNGRIPKQPAVIKLEGPIDLKAAENKELAEMLDNQSEPAREVRNSRSREYPDIPDQIGAIMAEFERRQDAGEKLSPELAGMLTKISETKKKTPKRNKDIGL